jgi:hypothetical protein
MNTGISRVVVTVVPTPSSVTPSIDVARGGATASSAAPPAPITVPRHIAVRPKAPRRATTDVTNSPPTVQQADTTPVRDGPQ